MDKATISLLLNKCGINIDASAILTPPLHFDKGLISIDADTFINFDCVFLDNGGIHIGKNVFIGPKVTLCTVTHSTIPAERLAEEKNIYAPIIIKNNAFIGAGVVVLPGVTIGENSVIAANSVVTHDVPENALYAGSPARFVRSI